MSNLIKEEEENISSSSYNQPKNNSISTLSLSKLEKERKKSNYSLNSFSNGKDNSDLSQSNKSSKIMKKIQKAISFNEKTFPFWPPDVLVKLSENGLRTFEFELSLAEKIFVTFEDPNSCVLGFCLSIFMTLIIFVSALQYILASDPSIMTQPTTCASPACNNDPDLCPGREICEPVPPFFMIYIDGLCVFLFTIDYLIRITLSPWMPARLAGTFDIIKWDNKFAYELTIPDPIFHPFVNFRRYILRPMNIIDLVAILPFYFLFVSTGGASLTIFRILRLGRVLRITKAGKNNSGFIILINTIKRSGDVLLMMLFYVLLCVIVIAALVFQFEKGSFRVTKEYPNGAYYRPSVDMHGEEVSPYISLWVTIYWSIVTGTTLGYGDLYPTTLGGRLISCFWIFCGVLILGLPISVIGSNFGVEFEIYKKLLNEKKKRKREVCNESLMLQEISSYFQEPINRDITLDVGDATNHLKELELTECGHNQDNNNNNNEDMNNNNNNNMISNEEKTTKRRSTLQRFKETWTRSFNSIASPDTKSKKSEGYMNESQFRKKMYDIESNAGMSETDGNDEIYFEDDDDNDDNNNYNSSESDYDSDVDRRRREYQNKKKDYNSKRNKHSSKNNRVRRKENRSKNRHNEDNGDDKMSWGSSSKERQLQILDELRRLIEAS